MAFSSEEAAGTLGHWQRGRKLHGTSEGAQGNMPECGCEKVMSI